MKKLSIRSFFVLVLVLVMGLALVACGEKEPEKPKDTPNVENVQAFFNTLWEKSSSIGNSKVGAKDNLKVDLGLNVKLATQDENGTELQAVDLGIDLNLVLDRQGKEDSSENTAIKARLYDPSNAGETWLTLYFFFNDVDNVYVDFAGQNFKVPFDYANDTFNDQFDNFINNDKLVGENTLGQVITALTKNTGAGWNLNTLVDDVVKLFDLDLKGLVQDGGMIQGIVEGLLGDGASIDDVFDGDKLDIGKILSNENIAAALFINDETIVNDNGFYSTAIDLNGEIAGMVIEMIPDGVDAIINENTGLYLQYQIANNALDSFGIKAVITDLETEIGDTTVVPALTLNITDLKFSRAEANAIEKSMPTQKSNYSENAVLDLNAALDLEGFSLDATKLDSLNGDRFSKIAGLDNLQLKGQISVGLTGKVNLKNNNGTAAYAHLSYKADSNATAVKVLEASFVNGNLAVVVNQNANLVALDKDGKTVNVPIASTLVNLWGDYAYDGIKKEFFKTDDTALKAIAEKLFTDDTHRTLNPDFVGAEWTGLDIVTGFKGVLDGVFASFAKTSADDTAAIVAKVISTIQEALPLVSTADNKLAASTSNIGETVDAIGKIWWKKGSPSFIKSIIDADKSNWLDKFTEAIKIKGATYTTKEEFLNAIFASSANVSLDMSKTGLNLGVDVKVTDKAKVNLTLGIGAKASETITDLSAGWKEDANTFVFDISNAPTSGTIGADGKLTLTGVKDSVIEVRIGDADYQIVEGTWDGTTFTSSAAIEGLKEGALVKARMKTPDKDGASFGVKMTNKFKATEEKK